VNQTTDRQNSTSRREFFTRIQGAAVATAVPSTVPFGLAARADETSPNTSKDASAQRVQDSYEIRLTRGGAGGSSNNYTKTNHKPL
jgi:hypothetical protein